MQTALYGLRDAPRARWKRVVRDLTDTAWVQHLLDHCTFMFMIGAELVGPILCGRFLLKGICQWRAWIEDTFTLTRIENGTLLDGGFHLRQQKFVDQLELMSLSQLRPRADTDKLTPGELTQLRGVSGSANWLGNQTRPDLCVSTSLLQGAHASATVADTREANKVIRLCRQHAHVPIRVSPIPVDDLTLVGFGDSGWSVPRDGSAQGGSLTIAAGERILHGSKAMTMD